jgi:PadR family transcriptional regulator PadR
MYDMEPVQAMKVEASSVGEALDRLRRGAIESCVLTLLVSGPAYSHDIVRRLSDIPGLVTSEGTLYPMLSRLRRAGLVETHWQESPSGPPRRYYALTDDGTRAVAAFFQAWQTFRGAVDLVVGDAATASGTHSATEETR